MVIIALLYGRWPSVLAVITWSASTCSLFLPRGTLAVSDVQYLLTFGVMLTVGLLIGNLTAGVRYQARVARYREQRTRHLYEMSKALAVGRSEDDIASTSERFIASTFQPARSCSRTVAATAPAHPPAGADLVGRCHRPLELR